MFIGEKEAKKLGYATLHHSSGDKAMCFYLNKDGVGLEVVLKKHNKESGQLVAKIIAIHGMTTISSPEIAFPHNNFSMFENEVYKCFPEGKV